MTSDVREFKDTFIGKFVLQSKAEGKAEGEARAILTVLDARGIHVPDNARTRIASSTDLDQLDTWARRAATVATVDELFV